MEERDRLHRWASCATVAGMGSSLWTAVAVAVALLGTPMAALYCNPSDAASMACCKEDMTGCNLPGKTEDCCREVPQDQETATVTVKAERLAKIDLAALALEPAALPTGVAMSAPSRTCFAVTIPLFGAAAPSPPRTPILRI